MFIKFRTVGSRMLMLRKADVKRVIELGQGEYGTYSEIIDSEGTSYRVWGSVNYILSQIEEQGG